MTFLGFATTLVLGLAAVFIVCWALEEDDVRRWHDFTFHGDLRPKDEVGS